MKIGHFSSRGTDFIGAVFGEKVLNFSEAASRAGKPVLSDLTSLLGQERFDSTLFAERCNREKDRQECMDAEIEKIGILRNPVNPVRNSSHCDSKPNGVLNPALSTGAGSPNYSKV